jgi:hypothetical protein
MTVGRTVRVRQATTEETNGGADRKPIRRVALCARMNAREEYATRLVTVSGGGERPGEAQRGVGLSRHAHAGGRGVRKS